VWPTVLSSHTIRPTDRWLGERRQRRQHRERPTAAERKSDWAEGSVDRAACLYLVIIVGNFLRSHHILQSMKELTQERSVTQHKNSRYLFFTICRNLSNVTMRIVKHPSLGKKILSDIHKVILANETSNVLSVGMLLEAVTI
jgi:hypothetical protein